MSYKALPVRRDHAMTVRKRLLALASSALALALLAMPMTALADTLTITDSDLSGGVYNMNRSLTYVLGGDIHGSLKVSAWTKAKLDMNGHSIISSDGPCLLADGDQSSITVYSSQGDAQSKLVQKSASHAAVRVDGGSQTSVTLRDVALESVGHLCADAESGSITVESGSCTVDNTAGTDEALLRASSNGRVCVKGGSFTNDGGSKITTDSTGRITLSGGSFSAFPEAVVDDGDAMLCNSDGSYVVGATVDVQKSAKSLVTIANAPYSVYFESEDMASEFAKSHDGEVKPVWITVSFDTADGTEIASQKILYNTCPTRPESDPTRYAYAFKYWTIDDASEYRFDVALTKDVTVKAIWNPCVVAIGDDRYETLAAALAAAGDGDTIKLLDNLTESVNVGGSKVTLDLNGKTLTSAPSQTAIRVSGSAELTIKNGTISAAGDGVSMGEGARGATVTLESVNVSSASSSAVSTAAGILIVTKAGTYNANGRPVLLAYGSANVRIDAGEFTSAEANALYVGDSVTVTINDGTFETEDDRFCAVYASGRADVTIYDGKFVGKGTSGDSGRLRGTAIMTIKGGDFSRYVDYDYASGYLSVSGGTFGGYYDAPAVVDGKSLLERKDGRFEVVDAATAKTQAKWVVASGLRQGFKAYFLTADKAKYLLAMVQVYDTATLKAINSVTFVAEGDAVETRYLEEGEQVGTLPKAREVEGYTFLGWYVDGEYSEDTKLSADTQLWSDMRAEALWIKDEDPDPDPEPTPTPDPDDKGDDDKGTADEGDEPKASDARATPQTGDAGSAAALLVAVGSTVAAVGVLRRRR